MRRSMLALLAVAGLALSSAPCLASGASRNSLDLQGTWNWDASYRAQGAGQTPRSSGYGLQLTIRSNGSYTLIERDSASAYARCAGRLRTDPNRPVAGAAASPGGAAFASLTITGWEPRYDAYTAALQGRDTLLLYPARPGTGHADAAVQRFVRAGRDAEKTPRLYSRALRPPRLVSEGYGAYDVAPPDSADRLARLTSPFRKAPDRDYSESMRAAYRYRHDQTPAAVIGDFDGDGVYDVALYGTAGSDAEAICVLDWNRAGQVMVLGKEPAREGADPGLYLELVPKGSRVTRVGGEGVLTYDAIRAVHAGGQRELFEWNGTTLASCAEQ
ncbi:MAG TPA: hypothetical protein VFM00_00100 [Candidatus Eisenbacteria bacterium]|nr:hypothetical protein [Candidatus Eisenbacteria bacterium]